MPHITSHGEAARGADTHVIQDSARKGNDRPGWASLAAACRKSTDARSLSLSAGCMSTDRRLSSVTLTVPVLSTSADL